MTAGVGSKPTWRKIVPGSGTLYCEGPPAGRNQGVTSCDGGPDLFRGRRARWFYGSRPMCGTCKKVTEQWRRSVSLSAISMSGLSHGSAALSNGAPLGDPYSLGDETTTELQMTAGERVYCDAHDEWLEIAGRDSGAQTTAEHVYLRIAEHVRRQVVAEINAVADRRTGTIRSVMLTTSELITPGTPTRILEQRRGMAER